MQLKELILGVTTIFFCSLTCTAQTYPNRVVRLVAPYAPGGGSDIMARMLAQKLTQTLGQSVIIDNRPGGGGIIGTAIVAKSPADGYTLLLGATGALAVNPSLQRNLPYDTVRDFAPVSLVSSIPNMLAVHPSLPVKSVRELIALAKARPGQLTFSSAGNGGSSHLAGVLFDLMAGVNMLHVPYRGTEPAILALLSGEVTLCFGTILSMMPYVQSGRLRGLAVSSVKRSPAAPNLPTVSQAGLPGFETGTWHGVLAPAGTPVEIIARLNGDLVRIMGQPDMREKLSLEGAEIIASSPEQFSTYIKSELKRWAGVVKEAGIRAD